MKNDADKFMETIVNWAVVLKADLRTVEEIKQYLSTFPGVFVVYQKTSFNKLKVSEENGEAKQ